MLRDSYEPWVAAPGSLIAADDQLTKPHQISHNIANAVISAVDHLHALDSIMIVAGASHALAPFSLVRGAIESAAQAAWISAPMERNERILRSLSLSAKVANDRAKAYEELASQRPEPGAILPHFESDKADLQDILDSCGITAKLILPTSTQILKDVRSLVPRTSVLSIWQLCSGFAHGRRWASDAALKPVQTTSLADDVLAKENRPTMRLLVWTLTAAMDLTRYSIDRYAELRKE